MSVDCSTKFTQAFAVSVSCSTKFNQVFAMSIICSTKFTQAFAMSIDCSTKFTQAFAMSVDCSTNFTQAFAMSVDCSTKFTQAFVLQATDTTKAWERGYIPHPSHIIIHMQAFPVFSRLFIMFCASLSICKTGDKERPGNEAWRLWKPSVQIITGTGDHC